MRVRRLVHVLLVAIFLLGAGCTHGVEARLPSKRAWLADVRQAMHGSLAYVDRRVERGGRDLAINLDIDNTSLATEYAPGQPVRPVLRFAKHARRQGVRVLFNTGRPSGNGRLARTRRQLIAAGYRVDGLCLRRPGEAGDRSKQRCRRRFVAQGYTIIANVGNRPNDFVGGNYERAFRLPNYDGRLS